MNAPAKATVLFAGDWRRRYLDAIEEGFPNNDQGVIRRVLAVALARATTPGEAATAMAEAARDLKLTWVQVLELNAILSTLRMQALNEAE